MKKVEIGFAIKCNMSQYQYLYWNGVTWTFEIKKARVMSEKEAEKELKTLSPPRFFDKTGKFGLIGPHVFEL